MSGDIRVLVIDPGFAPATASEVSISEGEEHETIEMPLGVVRPDGGYDIFPDVFRYFQLVFKKDKLKLQLRNWVGYVPLNERVALNIKTRVPVANVERMLRFTAAYSPRVLEHYERSYVSSTEDSPSVIEVLSLSFLSLCERLAHVGLLGIDAEYFGEGAFPFGRIDPRKSALLSLHRGHPQAAFTFHRRSLDSRANRILKAALVSLQALFAGMPAKGAARSIVRRIENVLPAFRSVSELTPHDVQASSPIFATPPPSERLEYLEAIGLALQVLNGSGIRLPEIGEGLRLPSMLLDFEDLFEKYLRATLQADAGFSTVFKTLDGNEMEPDGGGRYLYEPPPTVPDPPKASPDIVVIDSSNVIRLLLDAKYKPPGELPERQDVNQIVSYGARYGCNHVMVAYPQRNNGQSSVELVGAVGAIKVYKALFDLSASDPGKEQRNFAAALQSLLS